MTTIVAVETPEGVTFATDSRVSGPNLNDGWVSKVFQNNGMVFGIAGYLRVSQVMQHMKLPDLPKSDKPEKIDKWMTQVFAPVFLKVNKDMGDSGFRSGSNALVSVKGRVYDFASDGSWSRNASGVYSIGSGASYALGALEAGATPKKAIKVAAKYDWGTNSDVRIMKVSRPA